MSAESLVLNTQEALDLGLWEDFPGTIDHLVEKCAQPAKDLREAVGGWFRCS